MSARKTQIGAEIKASVVVVVVVVVVWSPECKMRARLWMCPVQVWLRRLAGLVAPPRESWICFCKHALKATVQGGSVLGPTASVSGCSVLRYLST